MPIGTTYTLANILLIFPAIVVAILKGPETPDVYAVLGAVCATAIVVLDAKYKTRNETISLIIGCGSVGSIAPGLIIHFWFTHLYDTLTWHAWAGLGLLFGGFGYGLIKLLWVSVGKRAGDYAEEVVEKVTGKTHRVNVKKPEDDE